jgi:hypothetical protein
MAFSHVPHVLTQLGENLSEYFDGLIKDGAFMIHVFASVFTGLFQEYNFDLFGNP